MSDSGVDPKFAACTIIAKNYLPMARVLVESWARFHPRAPFYVLLLDSPQGFFAPEQEQFSTVEVTELSIPNLDGFLFKYSILEASTAVKPFFLSHLFERYSVERLLYLDPDILVLKPLSGLMHYLDEASILLTPHLLSPLPDDGHRQTDHDILKSGVYNLGFLGLRNDATGLRLLEWWSKKVYHHCLVALENSLFVDQRWMDLAPAIFDPVRIVREPGYNMAYWNLHERTLQWGDEITVNGQPLYFFHFSGYDPDKPWIVSRHQNRFDMSNIGETARIYELYRQLLVDKGFRSVRDWTYGHDFFRNGVRIPASARRYYWGLGPNVEHLGNPFLWLDASQDGPQPRTFDFSFGINLSGHFESETGIGESVRSNLRIVKATGVPYVVNNLVDPHSRNVVTAPERPVTDNPYAVNWITLNADQFGGFSKLHQAYMRGRFNIGYWAWELPEFPAEWGSAFGYADEVWTPSRFTRDAIRSASPIPVTVVPHCIDPTRSEIVADRERFGLQPGIFVFLFLFDHRSYMERKNPIGLVTAFRNAFGQRRDVQLVIKTSNAHMYPDQVAELERTANGSNIRLFDSILSRDEKDELMMAADCYVSLHRSEGFGLTLAEAMWFGKPAIATAYSGNMDFMSEEDSFLVPYRLATIQQTHGPYKAGYHWADPDLDCAADLMREVELNREAAAAKALMAQRRVSVLLHPDTVALAARKRLEVLGLLPAHASQEAFSSSH